MSSYNRGLASADEETKERVAKAGGEARAQDKEELSEAGRRGRETISQDFLYNGDKEFRIMGANALRNFSC